jgi:hypothetical protein
VFACVIADIDEGRPRTQAQSALGIKASAKESHAGSLGGRTKVWSRLITLAFRSTRC